MDPRQLKPPASPPVSMSLWQTLGNAFRPVIWRSLWQQATQRQYWLQAAAIAYGLLLCLLLGGLMLLAGISLSDAVRAKALLLLAQWNPSVVAVIQALITQFIGAWEPSQRVALWAISGGLGVSLWVKLVGMAQRLLRDTGRTTPRPISLRQRLATGLVGLITVALLGLAYGFVFAVLPAAQAAIAEPTVWVAGQQLLVQGLRWSLAVSTILLMFGVFYRFSLKPAMVIQPILPGTVLATAIWTGLAVLLKLHISGLSNHHWLYSLISTLTLVMTGLYLCSVGLLLGGGLNGQLSQYFPKAKAQSQTSATPPPPSFESFTIHRRSDRRW